MSTRCATSSTPTASPSSRSTGSIGRSAILANRRARSAAMPASPATIRRRSPTPPARTAARFPSSPAAKGPSMTDSKPLAGRLALVTGASRGIGAATAEALAAAGAHVILVARTAQALEEVEQRIHEAGGAATIAPLDLTDGESIGKLAAAVGERWPALDVLVLNAAMLGSLTPVEHIDAKEYSRLLAINLLAPQALIAAFDPLLRRAERADIVTLTSSVGREPRAFWGAYGSSKAALETLVLAYADETEHAGKIRVH